MMTLSRRTMLAAAAAVLAASGTSLRAQGTYPSRTIRLVVSSSAGASLDILARILAPHLSEALGQNVVVENQGGGNGLVAINQVARAEADGHTLLLTGDAIVLSELITPNPGYSVRESFAPVTLAIRAGQVIVARAGGPYRSIADYVAAARAKPGQLNIGIPSWGGIAHVLSEMLNAQLGGLKVEYVAYRGGGPAVVDLLAGQLDAVVITLPAVTEHVRQGRLMGLAATTASRDAALPDVPTLAETVAPGFEVDSWQGIFAPVGTPGAAVARLHEAIAGALARPAVATRLVDLGFEVVAAPPAAFAARVADAGERFAPIIRAAGIVARGG